MVEMERVPGVREGKDVSGEGERIKVWMVKMGS